MDSALALACELIARPSVTPEDAGCQQVLINRLKPLGFVCETLMQGEGAERTTNLWAFRPGHLGEKASCLVFAGHTDVVPPGPIGHWTNPPFEPMVRDSKLYGRGAADMKGSIAAAVVALEQLLQSHPDPAHSLAVLLTSDEEGPARYGTKWVCEVLAQRQIPLTWCIVGEPTASEHTGDTVKNGRRGSLSGRLTVQGVQGHIAYPHLAKNPVHDLAPALAELTKMAWDEGNAHFPPTTWQISNIHAGTGANNVIPGQCVVDFNFRFSTASTATSLQSRLERVLKAHHLYFYIDWTLGAEPFLTPEGSLVEAARRAVQRQTGQTLVCSTTGGTSDARFLAKLCPQVLELGPPNRSIHQVDEHIALPELAALTRIYLDLFTQLVVS
jgi:succinyl-diaminopimelate desuccinylase